MRRIGVFGGTFDPVHYGHLQLATAALEETMMSELLFLPSAVPPHKINECICSFEHRCTMLNLALEDRDQIHVSDLEYRLPPPSYTYDTLNYMRTRYDSDTKMSFIIGCDAFLDIESWYRWRDVLFGIDFLVAVRPGYDEVAVVKFLTGHGFVQSRHTSNEWTIGESGSKVLLLSCETEDISSTELRHRIKNNISWSHLVPREVAQYINLHSLYRADSKPVKIA